MSKEYIDSIRSQFKPGHPRVGAIINDGVSEYDLCEAMRIFDQAGCSVTLIAPREGLVQAWGPNGLGHSFLVNTKLQDAGSADLDVLFIPGGERSVASLRDDNDALRFVADFIRSGKTIAVTQGAHEMIAPEDRVAGGEGDVLAFSRNVIMAQVPNAAADTALAALLLAVHLARDTAAAA